MGVVSWLVVAVLAGLGTAFVALSAVGILRMPDLYTRMHASSKAATLGAILILLAVAVRFGDAAVSVRAALICLFLLMTAPVASHVIARAAFRSGVPLSEETTVNEHRSTES